MVVFTGTTVEEAIETGLSQLGLSRMKATIKVISKEKKGFLGFGKQLAQVDISPLAKEEEEVAAVADKPRPSKVTDFSAKKEQIEAKKAQAQALEDQKAAAQAQETSPAPAEPAVEVAPLDYTTQPAVSAATAPVAVEEEPVADADQSFDAFVEQEFKSSRHDIAKAAADVVGYLETIIYEMDLEAKLSFSHNRRYINVQIETSEPGRVIGYHGKVLKALQLLSQNYLHDRYSKNFNISLNVNDYVQHRTETLIDFATKIAERVLSSGQSYRMDPMSNTERKIVHKTISRISGVESYSEGDDPNRYVVVVSRD